MLCALRTTSDLPWALGISFDNFLEFEMTNLNHGQTSTETTGSSANQTDQLHAARNATTTSGAEKSSNAENGKAQKSESAANTPNLQNGQSAVSLAASGKRIGSSAVLPGESGDKYFKGLASTIEELGAKTMMQVYLAEKIFQCMWSMSRYEIQKRSCLIAEMVKALKNDYEPASEKGRAVTQLLEAGSWESPEIESKLKACGYTAQSLTQRAFERRMEEIMQLDQLISFKAHTISALQKTYERLVSRSIMQERLKLQNELLKRDLQAIDIPMLHENSRKSEDRTGEQADELSEQVSATPRSLSCKRSNPVSNFQMDLDEDEFTPSDVTPKDRKSKGAKSKSVKPKADQGLKNNAPIKSQESL